MKIKELAKEFSMNSMELIDKIKPLGIKVKSAADEVDEEEVEKIRGKFKKKADADSKIVKVAPKKHEKEETGGDSKVKVKESAALKTPTAKIPAAKTQKTVKAVQDADVKVKNGKAVPVGEPVVPNDVKERAKKTAGIPVVPKEILEEKKNESGNQQSEPLDIESKTEKESLKEDKKQSEDKKGSVDRSVQEAPVSEKENTENKTEKENTENKSKKENNKAEEKDIDKSDKAAAEKKDTNEKPKGKDREKRAERKPTGPVIVRTAAEEHAREEAAKKAAQEKKEKKKAAKKTTNQEKKRKAVNTEIKAAEPVASKGDGKQGRKKKDKEHSRFDKFDNQHELGSLEKKEKHKKKNKPKPAPEPEVEEAPLPAGTKVINVPITVAGLSEQLQISVSKIIMTLMKLGIMANVNQTLDDDTVVVLAEEMGINVVIGKVEEETEEKGIENFEDSEEDLQPRPPIITVMGHVDHGKTSLLDAIRNTNVTAGESGGITQHIGASEVEINGQKIVFLDTPGHEAFTAMRARGAYVTDIAVLVVAADDSVKPQTIESISHAKAAGVPIIVAINKMDKPGANPDRVKKDLADNGVLVEDWGGDVISVPVSAKTGEGIVNLLEMILLQAEVLELKANPDRLAMGTVIEARLDKAKGAVATLLVTNGTLKSTMSVVAGTAAGRIRLMTDYKGKTIHKAGPATAVEILGLSDVPFAGDEFNAVKNDKTAKEIAEQRKLKKREEVMARTSSSTLEELFSKIQEGEVKELNLIVKGDVQGSVGAITTSLEKLSNENVKVKIIHTGVGAINESDVMLAGTSDAIIIGFNVRPAAGVTQLADKDNVQIRTYRVIYDIIDDVENAMKGMLDPEFKEVVLGQVEIRTTFKVPGVGVVGGAYVTEGKVVRNAEVRLVRDGIVIHEGQISSLKRFKDDVKEVMQGYECGIGIEDYNDIKEGDVIECFEMQEVERK